MRKITYNGQSYSFDFSEPGQSWTGEVELNKTQQYIELFLTDFKGQEPDWRDLEDFLHFFNSSLMEKLTFASKTLLAKFTEVASGYSNLEECRFESEGIIYRGKKQGRIFNSRTHHYALLFFLYRKGYAEVYDTYGSYFVEIDSELITGCRREQV